MSADSLFRSRALMLYLIVGAIASVPYIKWLKWRRQGTLVV